MNKVYELIARWMWHWRDPGVSVFLVSTPYDGRCGRFCPGCGAPKDRRHGQWCVVND